MSVKLAYLLAVIGAALWGVTGLFVQNLQQIGFSSWEVVGIRAIFSVLILFVYVLLFNRRLLQIKFRHLPIFIGTGIISIVFFNYFFFTVMNEANLSLAVVLLYTGPLFVTILSRFIFHEYLTHRKIIAIIFTLIGCAFVVGLLPSVQTVITASTLLAGLGSGFFYALYSIFAKIGSRYYGALTITLYSFICASSFMLFFSPIVEKAELFLDWTVLLNSVGLAFFPTVLAYIVYTQGLTYIESSRAAILSTVEPVVAIGIGFIFFHDTLSMWQGLGVIFVVLSVVLASESAKENPKKTRIRAS